MSFIAQRSRFLAPGSRFLAPGLRFLALGWTGGWTVPVRQYLWPA